MIAVGVGILVALVATVVFFVVYNSSRKGWQQSLTARESEAADLKVRNGVLEAQVKSCTARLAEVQDNSILLIGSERNSTVRKAIYKPVIKCFPKIWKFKSRKSNVSGKR
mgnify:CR=1 FL=1